MFKIVFIICAFVYGFIYLILAAKTGKPFKTMFLFALAGIMGLFIVNLTSKYSGIYLPLNYVTVGSSSAFGLVGTVGLLLVRMIFM